MPFEHELKNAYIGEYVGEVYTFDFQNNWSLNWTAQSLYWTPTLTSGQWWTIGSSSSSDYQSFILPPNSVYDWNILKKVKIRMYKWQATYYSGGTIHQVGCWLGNNNLSNMTSWGQPQFNSSTWALVNDWSNHFTQTSDITGEVTQEWNLNDDWSLTLSLSWGTPYNLWQYANLFRTNRSNSNLWLSIGRWSSANGNIYIRKVEITTY